MNTMAIMMGIQGSGKSTFVKEKFPDFVRVNLDTLHTRNKENKLIEESFKNHKDMVIDNTNPTKADREKYILAAKANGYHIVGYFMQSVLKECINRNNLREGKAKIPASAIAATSNRMELPDLREGFDELFFVSITEDGFKIDKWR